MHPEADVLQLPRLERQAEGRDAYWATHWQDDNVFYGHVLGFEGLERQAVLVVNGFRDEERAREMLYVALSRAGDLMAACDHLELIRRVGGEEVARRLIARPGLTETRKASGGMFTDQERDVAMQRLRDVGAPLT